jgi:lysozyme family protein
MTHPTWLDDAMDFILQEEGGYDEREAEGGGAVNMGVTLKTLRLYRNNPNLTKEDLRAISRDEVVQIFMWKYAIPVHFDAYGPGVGYLLFDSAVNNGVTGCQRFLEKAVGHETDGHFDPDVFWAARHKPPADLINAFCDARKAEIPNMKVANDPIKPGSPRTWGDALLSRNERVRQRALEMAAE